jgi:hypothetical protein
MAICEGHRSTGFGLLCVAAGLVYVAAVAVPVARARGERLPLLATGALALAAGAAIAVTPGGLSASDADYLARWFGGLGAGAVLGLLALAVRRRRPITYVVTGILGGGAFLALLVLLLIGALAFTGGCID